MMLSGKLGEGIWLEYEGFLMTSPSSDFGIPVHAFVMFIGTRKSLAQT